MWSAYRDPAQSSESGVQAQTLFPSDYASPNSAKFRYIKDVRGIETIAENAGHSWITSFPLSASAWWDDYYTPLLARLPALEEKYRIQPEAQAIIAVTKQEISLYHQYPDEYGYQFILLKNGECPMLSHTSQIFFGLNPQSNCFSAMNLIMGKKSICPIQPSCVWRNQP